MIEAILTDGQEIFKRKTFADEDLFRQARYCSIQASAGNVIWEKANGR